MNNFSMKRKGVIIPTPSPPPPYSFQKDFGYIPSRFWSSNVKISGVHSTGVLISRTFAGTKKYLSKIIVFILMNGTIIN